MPVQRWELDQAARRRMHPNGPVVRVVIGTDDGQRTGVIEVTVPPGGVMHEHAHGASEVLVVTLAGRARLVSAADGAAMELGPGAVATIPVGERVSVENPNVEAVRLLVVLTPADFAQALASWPEVEGEA